MINYIIESRGILSTEIDKSPFSSIFEGFTWLFSEPDKFKLIYCSSLSKYFQMISGSESADYNYLIFDYHLIDVFRELNNILLCGRSLETANETIYRLLSENLYLNSKYLDSLLLFGLSRNDIFKVTNGMDIKDETRICFIQICFMVIHEIIHWGCFANGKLQPEVSKKLNHILNGQNINTHLIGSRRQLLIDAINKTVRPPDERLLIYVDNILSRELEDYICDTLSLFLTYRICKNTYEFQEESIIESIFLCICHLQLLKNVDKISLGYEPVSFDVGLIVRKLNFMFDLWDLCENVEKCYDILNIYEKKYSSVFSNSLSKIGTQYKGIFYDKKLNIKDFLRLKKILLSLFADISLSKTDLEWTVEIIDLEFSHYL